MHMWIDKFTEPVGYMNSDWLDTIILTEEHEAGDIIEYNNRIWIIDVDTPFGLYPNEAQSKWLNKKFPIGYAIKIWNIRYIDIFSSHQLDLDQKNKYLEKINEYYPDHPGLERCARYKVHHPINAKEKYHDIGSIFMNGDIEQVEAICTELNVNVRNSNNSYRSINEVFNDLHIALYKESN